MPGLVSKYSCDKKKTTDLKGKTKQLTQGANVITIKSVISDFLLEIINISVDSPIVLKILLTGLLSPVNLREKNL